MLYHEGNTYGASDWFVDRRIYPRFKTPREQTRKVSLYLCNGTNSIGAQRFMNWVVFQKMPEMIFRSCWHDGIDWRFIPPNSPHFSGLWKAGVKSSKFHIKRVVGQNKLTFKEFFTLLVQIVVILNSGFCILYPLSPAHFLIGKPLVLVSGPDVRHISENRL